jgi:undecaprenyl diphosphate synthase
MEEAERLTEQNKTMRLNLALSYGGRWDILQAVKSFIAGDNPNLSEDKFNETISAQSFSDIDLLIRTGNENRISNFGLWQLAYAEIYFSKVLWPDFNEGELDKAIQLFESAKRRFGGVHE